MADDDQARDQNEDSRSEDEARSAERSEDESQSEEKAGQSSGGDTSDAEGQEITAPSVGPHTTFDRTPPEERLDFDKISDTDAMGKEKKRTVVGGTYGPTRARVFATFATFFAVVAALVVGLYFLAKELDQPPKESPDEAPWAQEVSDQKPPRPLQ